MKQKHFLVSAGLLGLTVAASAAAAVPQTFVDLEGGFGYSSNPFLLLGDDLASGFLRVSARGYHGWSTERSNTSFSAYIENNSYLRGGGSRQNYSLSGNTSFRASEKLSLFGGLDFSSDIGGQLSSRFLGAPSAATPTDTAPVSEIPVLTPLPSLIVIVDPDLLGTRQRTYRFGANAGAQAILSPRGTLTVNAGAEQVSWSNNEALQYRVYNGSVAYNHRLSERVSVGGRMIASYADYPGGRSVSTIGPQATVSALVGPGWEVSGAAGFVRTKQEGGIGGLGDDSSIDLALDGSVCRAVRYDRFCARAARRTQTAISGGSPTATSASVDYSRQLGARDQLSFSLAAVRTGGDVLNTTDVSTFVSASGAYSRQIGPRLSTGVTAVARRLSRLGPDPKSDVGGTVFLRYRLGDVR